MIVHPPVGELAARGGRSGNGSLRGGHEPPRGPACATDELLHAFRVHIRLRGAPEAMGDDLRGGDRHAGSIHVERILAPQCRAERTPHHAPSILAVELPREVGRRVIAERLPTPCPHAERLGGPLRLRAQRVRCDALPDDVTISPTPSITMRTSSPGSNGHGSSAPRRPTARRGIRRCRRSPTRARRRGRPRSSTRPTSPARERPAHVRHEVGTDQLAVDVPPQAAFFVSCSRDAAGAGGNVGGRR